MNNRFASVLAFALVVATVASAAVYHLVTINLQSVSKMPIASQRTLVAARTLETGSLIQDADLRWVNTAGAAGRAVITDRAQAVGRGVISTIYEGEPISTARLAPKGAGAGLASMIPVGKRAVALKIDEVVGLAGFVVPGMRVDVIVAGGNADAGRNGTLSRTALQNIEVLSAGKVIEKTADGKPQDAQVVNLLVTPDQAEVLSLASTEAKVQLVLRNPLDTKEAATHGTSVAALFGLSPAAVAKAPAPVRVATVAALREPKPPTNVVEVFSGTKRVDHVLDGQR